MKEKKLEQLRIVFKKILDSYEVIGGWNVKEIVNELVYEVKIRGTDRKGIIKEVKKIVISR